MSISHVVYFQFIIFNTSLTISQLRSLHDVVMLKKNEAALNDLLAQHQNVIEPTMLESVPTNIQKSTNTTESSDVSS